MPTERNMSSLIIIGLLLDCVIKAPFIGAFFIYILCIFTFIKIAYDY